MRRGVLAGLLATLALAGCGDSAEDDAQARVCDARDDISSQIDTLKGLTASTVTADAVTESVEAIRNDLDTIKTELPEVGDDFRAEAQAANDAFTTAVRDVAATVLRSTSVEEARAQLEAATSALTSAYEASLGEVDCG